MESQAYPENSAAEKISAAILLLALDAVVQVRKTPTARAHPPLPAPS